MKRYILNTTGRTTSSDYIKVKLFDYMCDHMYDIDGEPAERIVERVSKLSPVFDVDDVLNLAYDEGLTFVEALNQIESESQYM